MPDQPKQLHQELGQAVKTATLTKAGNEQRMTEVPSPMIGA